jgi:predicted nuclease of predicted toxin-antitoxin system
VRFLLDENVRARLAMYLRGAGHDITTISDDYAAQLPDTEVLAIAQREQRVLITRDRDFERLIFDGGQTHTGVIYLRLHNPSLATIIARVDAVVSAYRQELADGRFLVVTEEAITVREAQPK